MSSPPTQIRLATPSFAKLSLAGQDNLSEARIAEFEFNKTLCSSSDKPWLRLITTD
jgi:hypothetical protein